MIVAFDGIVADTMLVRANALAVAAVEFGARDSVKAVVTTLAEKLPGRSLEEAARALVGRRAADDDPTVIELITLHAQRAISQRMRQGIDIDPDDQHRESADACGIS